jgi:hypothetical protein
VWRALSRAEERGWRDSESPSPQTNPTSPHTPMPSRLPHCLAGRKNAIDKNQSRTHTEGHSKWPLTVLPVVGALELQRRLAEVVF